MFTSGNSKKEKNVSSSERRRRDQSSKVDPRSESPPPTSSSRKSTRGDDRKGKRKSRGDERDVTQENEESSRQTSVKSNRTATAASGQDAPQDDYAGDEADRKAGKSDRRDKARSSNEADDRRREQRKSSKNVDAVDRNGATSRSLETTRATGSSRSDRAPSESEAPSLVPNQFPGQVPQDYSLPYRPAPSNTLGAAAEYYGDQGESVAQQPGIRPGTPVVVGTEPHLMAALPQPAPPQETGSGAAAEFYNSNNANANAPPTSATSYNTTSQTQPVSKPSRPPTNVTSTTSTPSNQPGSHNNAPLYAAGAAAGLAGISAAAYSHYQQGHRPPSNTNASTTTVSATQSSHSHSYPGQYPVETYEPRGPFGKFVDWWKDYEDVRKMEEYMQYIGVCKYCFDPQSSVWDAPRRHVPTKRSSRESLNRRRVSKSVRYQTSEVDGRGTSGAGLAAAGLAAVGLAEATKKARNRKSFDDFSIKSGEPESSRRDNARKRSSIDVESSTSRGVTSRDSSSRNKVDGRGSDAKSSSRSTRGVASSSARPESDAVRTRRSSNELQQSRGASKEHIMSEIPPRPVSELDGYPEVQLTRLNEASSSSDSGARPGFWSRLFTPTKSKKKGSRPKRERVSYRHSNSSESSFDTHLAYGSNLPRRGSKGKTKRKQSPEVSALDARNALLGLGAAAAVLGARDTRDQRKGIPPSVKSTKPLYETPGADVGRRITETHAPDPSQDGWESASEVDDASSVDSGLAFGGSSITLPKLAKRSSTESMSSASSETQGRKARYSAKKPQQTRPIRPFPSATEPTTPRASTRAFDQGSGRSALSKYGESRPLPNVPISISPDKDLPLQQPQPITPVRTPAVTQSRYLESSKLNAADERPMDSSSGRRSMRSRPFTEPEGRFKKLRRRSTEPVMPSASQRRDSSSSDSYEERVARKRNIKIAGAAAAGIVGAGTAAAIAARQHPRRSSSSESDDAHRDQRSVKPRGESHVVLSRSADDKKNTSSVSHGRDMWPSKMNFEENDYADDHESRNASITPHFQEPLYDTSEVRKPSPASTVSPFEDQSPEASPERQIETVVVGPGGHEAQEHEPICDDDLFNPDLFKNKAKLPSPRRIAETEIPDETPDDVFAALEDRYSEQPTSFATFFAPTDVLAQKAEGKTRRSVSFDKTDPGGPGYPMNTDWAFENPRPVPRLNVIPPTPPKSNSPDGFRHNERSESPSQSETSSQERVTSGTERRVTWAATPSKMSETQTADLDEEDQTHPGAASSQGEFPQYENTNMQARTFTVPSTYDDNTSIGDASQPFSSSPSESPNRKQQTNRSSEEVNSPFNVTGYSEHQDIPSEDQEDASKENRVRFALPGGEIREPQKVADDLSRSQKEQQPSQRDRKGIKEMAATGAFAAAVMSAEAMEDGKGDQLPYDFEREKHDRDLSRSEEDFNSAGFQDDSSSMARIGNEEVHDPDRESQESAVKYGSNGAQIEDTEGDWSTGRNQGKKARKSKKSKRSSTFDGEPDLKSRDIVEPKASRSDWNETSSPKEKKAKKKKRTSASWDEAENLENGETVWNAQSSKQNDAPQLEGSNLYAKTEPSETDVPRHFEDAQHPHASSTFRASDDNEQRNDSEIGTISHPQANKAKEMVSEREASPGEGLQQDDSFYDIEANASSSSLTDASNALLTRDTEDRDSNDAGKNTHSDHDGVSSLARSNFLPLVDPNSALPDDQPASTDDLSRLQTSHDLMQSPNTRSPSSTAIPLRFRRPPQSPGLTKDSPLSHHSPAFSDSFTPIRPRQNRPASTEFKSSTEMRPLYLLERNTKLPEPDETLPSLPSSRATSRSGSVEESSTDLYESAPESPSSEHGSQPDYFRSFDQDPRVETALLDSGQSTPKARKSVEERMTSPNFSSIQDAFTTSPQQSHEVSKDHASNTQFESLHTSGSEDLQLAEAGASQYAMGTWTDPEELSRETQPDSKFSTSQIVESTVDDATPSISSGLMQKSQEPIESDHTGFDRAMTEPENNLPSVDLDEDNEDHSRSVDNDKRDTPKSGKRKGKKKDSKKAGKSKRASSPPPLQSESVRVSDTRNLPRESSQGTASSSEEMLLNNDVGSTLAESRDWQASTSDTKGQAGLWRKQSPDVEEPTSKRQSWLLASGAALTAAMALPLPSASDDEQDNTHVDPKGLGISMQTGELGESPLSEIQPTRLSQSLPSSYQDEKRYKNYSERGFAAEQSIAKRSSSPQQEAVLAPRADQEGRKSDVYVSSTDSTGTISFRDSIPGDIHETDLPTASSPERYEAQIVNRELTTGQPPAAEVHTNVSIPIDPLKEGDRSPLEQLEVPMRIPELADELPDFDKSQEQAGQANIDPMLIASEIAHRDSLSQPTFLANEDGHVLSLRQEPASPESLKEEIEDLEEQLASKPAHPILSVIDTIHDRRMSVIPEESVESDTPNKSRFESIAEKPTSKSTFETEINHDSDIVDEGPRSLHEGFSTPNPDDSPAEGLRDSQAGKERETDQLKETEKARQDSQSSARNGTELVTEFTKTGGEDDATQDEIEQKPEDSSFFTNDDWTSLSKKKKKGKKSKASLSIVSGDMSRPSMISQPSKDAVQSLAQSESSSKKRESNESQPPESWSISDGPEAEQAAAANDNRSIDRSEPPEDDEWATTTVGKGKKGKKGKKSKNISKKMSTPMPSSADLAIGSSEILAAEEQRSQQINQDESNKRSETVGPQPDDDIKNDKQNEAHTEPEEMIPAKAVTTEPDDEWSVSVKPSKKDKKKAKKLQNLLATEDTSFQDMTKDKQADVPPAIEVSSEEQGSKEITYSENLQESSRSVLPEEDDEPNKTTSQENLRAEKQVSFDPSIEDRATNTKDEQAMPTDGNDNDSDEALERSSTKKNTKKEKKAKKKQKEVTFEEPITANDIPELTIEDTLMSPPKEDSQAKTLEPEDEFTIPGKKSKKDKKAKKRQGASSFDLTDASEETPSESLLVQTSSKQEASESQDVPVDDPWTASSKKTKKNKKNKKSREIEPVFEDNTETSTQDDRSPAADHEHVSENAEQPTIGVLSEENSKEHRDQRDTSETPNDQHAILSRAQELLTSAAAGSEDNPSNNDQKENSAQTSFQDDQMLEDDSTKSAVIANQRPEDFMQTSDEPSNGDHIGEEQRSVLDEQASHPINDIETDIRPINDGHERRDVSAIEMSNPTAKDEDKVASFEQTPGSFPNDVQEKETVVQANEETDMWEDSSSKKKKDKKAKKAAKKNRLPSGSLDPTLKSEALFAETQPAERDEQTQTSRAQSENREVSMTQDLTKSLGDEKSGTEDRHKERPASDQKEESTLKTPTRPDAVTDWQVGEEVPANVFAHENVEKDTEIADYPKVQEATSVEEPKTPADESESTTMHQLEARKEHSSEEATTAKDLKTLVEKETEQDGQGSSSRAADEELEFAFVDTKKGKKGKKAKKVKQSKGTSFDWSAEGETPGSIPANDREAPIETEVAAVHEENDKFNWNAPDRNKSISLKEDAAAQMAAIIAAEDNEYDSKVKTSDREQDLMPDEPPIQDNLADASTYNEAQPEPSMNLAVSKEDIGSKELEAAAIDTKQPAHDTLDDQKVDSDAMISQTAERALNETSLMEPEASKDSADTAVNVSGAEARDHFAARDLFAADEPMESPGKQAKTAKEKRKAKKAKKMTLKELEAQEESSMEPSATAPMTSAETMTTEPIETEALASAKDLVESRADAAGVEISSSGEALAESEKSRDMNKLGNVKSKDSHEHAINTEDNYGQKASKNHASPQELLPTTQEHQIQPSKSTEDFNSAVAAGLQTSGFDLGHLNRHNDDIQELSRDEDGPRDSLSRRHDEDVNLSRRSRSRSEDDQKERARYLASVSGASFDDVISAGLGAAGFQASNVNVDAPHQIARDSPSSSREHLMEFGHSQERIRSGQSSRKGSPTQMWHSAGSPRGGSPELDLEDRVEQTKPEQEPIPFEFPKTAGKANRKKKGKKLADDIEPEVVSDTMVYEGDNNLASVPPNEPSVFQIASKKGKKKKGKKARLWEEDDAFGTRDQPESQAIVEEEKTLQQEPVRRSNNVFQEDDRMPGKVSEHADGHEPSAPEELNRDSAIQISDPPDAWDDDAQMKATQPTLYRDSGYDDADARVTSNERRLSKSPSRSVTPIAEGSRSRSPEEDTAMKSESVTPEQLRETPEQRRLIPTRTSTFDLEQAEEGYGITEPWTGERRSSDSPQEEKELSPTSVDPASKTRTSYLFKPTTRSRNGSDDSTQKRGIVHQRVSSIENELAREPEQPELIEAPATKLVPGFGDENAGRGEPLKSMTSSTRPIPQNVDLEPIKETSREQSPTAKQQRSLSDVGTPEHSIKSPRRAGLEAADDVLSPKSFGSHSQLSYMKSPTGSEIANTKRVKRRSTSNDSTSGIGYIRSYGAAMDRSNTPSVVSNRSGTPTLRHVNRSISSDLRAANRRDAKNSTDDAKSETPTSSVLERPPNYAPLKGTGKDRRQEMSGNDGGVYQGWGDAQESPRSPTRPPSLRKRQSTHISELQSRLDEALAENRALQESSGATRGLGDVESDVAPSRDRSLREKDVEIQSAKASLLTLQNEVARLTEHNAQLIATNEGLSSDTGGKYATMQAEHERSREGWRNTQMELQSLRAQHDDLTTGMETAVRQQVDMALRAKNEEIENLRSQLTQASERIKSLQEQITSSGGGDDFLQFRDEEYFESACQQLCQHLQSWVKRFSKVSDMRACRPSSKIGDENIETRLDNAMLDGVDVDAYLSDRQKRREVFTSVIMTIIWEYVFTRYLFGLERDQRQKLKTLEKTLSEVGPPRAVAQWRATTLTLLSRRDAFNSECISSTEAVVNEIFGTLSRILPPPSREAVQLQESLRRLISIAVDLSIEMRTQRSEYVMLPPFHPEYDINGDLKRRIYFNASLMNERSENAEELPPNAELEKRQTVVRLVLFPLVVKKGDDDEESEEERVIFPAQVVIVPPAAPPPKGEGGIRRMRSIHSGGGSSRRNSGVGGGRAEVEGQKSANTSMLDVSNMV